MLTAPISASPISPLLLTPEDVAELLKPEPGNTGRLQVMGKLAGYYRDSHFTDSESQIAEQIFRLLARDVYVPMRVLLSQNLKDCADVPRDLVLTIAQDAEDAVAMPMLQDSEVLTEQDLLDMIPKMKGASRKIAVGKRKLVPPAISEALMVDPLKEVAETLAKNPGALLSEPLLERMVEKYAKERGLVASLMARPHLPKAIAARIATVAPKVVAEVMRQSAAPPPPEADSKDQAELVGVLIELRNDPTKHEMEKLLARVSKNSAIVPKLLMLSFAEGHITFAEMLLNEMTAIPRENVKKLLADRGDLGFRALFNKTGLPVAQMNPMRVLAQVSALVAEKDRLPPGPMFHEALTVRLPQAYTRLSESEAAALDSFLREKID